MGCLFWEREMKKVFILLALFVFIISCGDDKKKSSDEDVISTDEVAVSDDSATDDFEKSDSDVVEPDCTTGKKKCVGNSVFVCEDGAWELWSECSLQNKTCGIIEGEAQCVEGTTPVDDDPPVDKDTTKDDDPIVDSDPSDKDPVSDDDPVIDSDPVTDDEEVPDDDVAGIAYNISGLVQKGPFILGSQVDIQELDTNFAPIGKTYNTETDDDLGSFQISSKLSSQFTEIRTTGYYFNEVVGSITDSEIVFKVFADLSEGEEVNVNILTTLERERIKYLISTDGMSFSEARIKAEGEVLALFNINEDSVKSFQEMDISLPGKSNAILLAISAILQGDNSVSELSQLIANIIQDIKEDGTLDDAILIEHILLNSVGLNLSSVRSNLETRYSTLGLSVVVPEFEDYVDSDGDSYINKYDLLTDFADFSGVAKDTDYTSAAITIGLLENGATSVHASIDNGTLVVNGTDSAKEADLSPGDTLAIKLTSPSDFNQESVSTLTLSYTDHTETGAFKVSTLSDSYFDIVFTPRAEVVRDIYYTSNEVEVILPSTATDAAASVTAGTIVLNGVDTTTTTATVVDGDMVAIKLQSSASYNTLVSSELTISFMGINEKGTYSLTTYRDDYFSVSFTSVTDAERESVHRSELITVLLPANPDITEATAIVTNGRIVDDSDVDLGTTTTVSSGDQISVKITASSDFSTAIAATLTVSYEGHQEVGNYSVTTRDPDCTSGDCCNTDGTFKDSDFVCDTWIEYQCQGGQGCGKIVQQETREQRCSGSSSSCNGDESVLHSWSEVKTCDADEYCDEDGDETVMPECESCDYGCNEIKDRCASDCNADEETCCSADGGSYFCNEHNSLLWYRYSKSYNFSSCESYCGSVSEQNGDGSLTSWRIPTINEWRNEVVGCGDIQPGGACGVQEPGNLSSGNDWDINGSCNYGTSCSIGGGSHNDCYVSPEIGISSCHDGNPSYKYWSSSGVSDDGSKAWTISFYHPYITPTSESETDYTKCYCVHD